MEFILPALPFEGPEISGWLSRETLDFHYDRHHRAYFENLNLLLKGSGFEELSLEEIVRRSEGALYNNAAQAWNHTFYWQGICSFSNERYLVKNFPELKGAIIGSFGSLEQMLDTFALSAIKFFGSGWVWLVQNATSGKIEILQTSNAGNPIRDGSKPLLVCDVWEHAYYIDYRNARSRYVEGFLKSINWGFVDRCFKQKEICDLTRIMRRDSRSSAEAKVV